MTSNWETKDCCELLSAYLDGEVTAAEREQVEEWLATDVRMQQLHQRLMKLHHGWQNLSVPEPTQTGEQLAAAMFDKMEKRSRRRLYVLSGGAIAALFVATVSSLIFSDNSPMPQFAESESEPIATEVKPSESEPLRIAINQPVVPIPEAAMIK